MQRLKRMKILAILLAASILLSSCKYDSLQESSTGETDREIPVNLDVDNIELTGQENALIGKIGFDTEVFQLLKANFSSPITELEPDHHDDSIGMMPQ